MEIPVLVYASEETIRAVELPNGTYKDLCTLSCISKTDFKQFQTAMLKCRSWSHFFTEQEWGIRRHIGMTDKQLERMPNIGFLGSAGTLKAHFLDRNLTVEVLHLVAKYV